MVYGTEDMKQREQPLESQVLLAGSLVQALANSYGNQERGISAARTLVSSPGTETINWDIVVTAYVERAEQERKPIHPSSEEGDEEGDGEEGDKSQEDATMQPHISLSSICCHLIHGGIEKHGFSSMTLSIHSNRSQQTTSGA